MKCKIFVGRWYEAQDAFNAWAEGKQLTRDIIIHEQVLVAADEWTAALMAIIVYHPDDSFWDATETKPIRQVQPKTNQSTRVECPAVM